MARHLWEGHTIEVRLRPVASTLWLGAGLYVTVDGSEQFSPPPQFEGARSTTPFTITHDLRTVDGAVHVQVEKIFSLTTNFPYQLEVDGQEVGSGRITLEAWYLHWQVHVGMLILIGVLLAACFLLAQLSFGE
jgi:hypothetical protein